MKKILFVLFASLLVLGACGNQDETEKASEKKPSKSTVENKKENKEEKSTEEKQSSTQGGDSTYNNSSNQSQNDATNTTQQPIINITNITDQSVLESVIYGNYTEEQKTQAYNSAVANGVIPQSEVPQGSVQAYEESVRLQNGETKESLRAEKYQEWVDAGLMTEEEMEEELAK
ncbi:hypothetical protein KJB49_02790 [Staphylococcus chromogenes]|uniref:hypothetical protein n=1 Tax=Staphylococcus chromogenes TaxID=46126 RepID=UPI000D028926|nr:hypothetical protein [Staphylococcus chromogenes]MCE4970238.1 hypothetical protein [Staphylococcus chromogenes]